MEDITIRIENTSARAVRVVTLRVERDATGNIVRRSPGLPVFEIAPGDSATASVGRELCVIVDDLEEV